jgi:hypothetical protein
VHADLLVGWQEARQSLELLQGVGVGARLFEDALHGDDGAGVGRIDLQGLAQAVHGLFPLAGRRVHGGKVDAGLGFLGIQ